MRPINKILRGNTLDILKKFDSGFIDLSITSPPYNKGEKQKGWLVKNVKYDKASDNISEELYQEEQINVLNEIYRITKGGGSFFYNHKTRWNKGIMIHPIEWLLKTKWIIRQEIIWDRMIAANIRGWRFWQIDERIYWLYKPEGSHKIGTELKSKHALMTSIWRFPPARTNDHPAPFPLVLPARIIISILDDKKGGMVLDPYSGSGTTLAAAKLLNHHFIGIDISEEYIKDSERRLKNCKGEEYIILEELQKHVVSKTFNDRKINGEKTGKFKNSLFSQEKDKLHQDILFS